MTAGTYPVQVFNGSTGSNIVTYTLDNASGYWLLNSNGTIVNSNSNSSVSVSSLLRGIPISIDNTYNPYIILSNNNWIICDTSSGDVFITLPTSTAFIGREIMIKRLGTNNVYSTNTNIYSLTNDNTLSDVIVDSTQNYNWIWVTLVFDGTNWKTMQAATDTQGSTGSSLSQWNNGSSGAIYYNTGNVGIGTTTPSATLDISGNIVSSGTITSGSDYRIKYNIEKLKLEEYSVDKLNPVYFKFKDSEKESIGLIAHELQEHYPFLVEGEKDGEKIQTVNYNGLTGVLIKEIQELKKRINYLENIITQT